VLALERAASGERYVLGGENLPMRDIVRILSQLTGIRVPWFALPHRLLGAVGRVDEWLADHVTRRPPLVPREAALHARDSRAFDTGKLRDELGLVARPAERVLADAVAWFVDAGFCPAARTAAVRARLDREFAALPPEPVLADAEAPARSARG
jgi:dihydroflavonol-4-reductase